MTEADREALFERAAIMEYDAGLDRKTATLQAFALYFPEDYQAMMETAKASPDGETALYGFLEEQIKPSQTHEKDAALNAETEKEIHETAPEKPARQGIEALEYMTACGIKLIGAYDSGAAIAKGADYLPAFTADITEIKNLMEGRAKRSRIQRFYFIPQDAGLLCLDIDRKQGKPDGLKELYKLFPKDTLPRALQDIEQFFPCYVSTPSGGYHLYFKYNGELIRKTDLCPEVEVKHGKPGLTVPGSRKENGDYILHGNLDDAPWLYGIIIDRIAELQNPKQEQAAADRPVTIPRRPAGNNQQTRTPKQQITLDTLADEAAAAYAGHHDRQVSFAGKACRCKFSVTDAVAYTKANPGIFGTDPDTENTIRSVFYQNRGAV